MIKSRDISVVVQGAINKKETSKCLKSIRQFLPDAEIILSTWEDSDVTNLEYDILVLNKDPGGFKHDFAIQNIKRSKNTYILKLRSDLILKNANFLNYWDKFDTYNLQYKLFKHRVLSSSLY